MKDIMIIICAVVSITILILQTAYYIDKDAQDDYMLLGGYVKEVRFKDFVRAYNKYPTQFIMCRGMSFGAVCRLPNSSAYFLVVFSGLDNIKFLWFKERELYKYRRYLKLKNKTIND